ncbi:hypothetical protein pb186bvf_016771 [Paramecium bursaria]
MPIMIIYDFLLNLLQRGLKSPQLKTQETIKTQFYRRFESEKPIYIPQKCIKIIHIARRIKVNDKYISTSKLMIDLFKIAFLIKDLQTSVVFIFKFRISQEQINEQKSQSD